MEQKTIIEFTKQHGVYNAGQQAIFTPAFASRLLAIGVAKPVPAPVNPKNDHTDPVIRDAVKRLVRK